MRPIPSTGRAAGFGEACSSPTPASDRGLPQRLRIPVARPGAALRGPGGAGLRGTDGRAANCSVLASRSAPEARRRCGLAASWRPGRRSVKPPSHTPTRPSGAARPWPGARWPGPRPRGVGRFAAPHEMLKVRRGSARTGFPLVARRAARGVPGKGRHVPRVAIQPHDAHRSLVREGLERQRPAGGRRCVRPRDPAPGPRRRDVSDAVFPRAGNGPRRSGGDPLPCAKKPRAASSTRLIGGLRSCGGRARSRSQTSMTGAASATSRRSRRRPNLVRPSPPRSPRRRCRCGSALSRTRRPPPKAGPDFKGPRFLAGKGTFRVCPIWEDG